MNQLNDMDNYNKFECLNNHIKNSLRKNKKIILIFLLLEDILRRKSRKRKAKNMNLKRRKGERSIKEKGPRMRNIGEKINMRKVIRVLFN